MKDVIGSFKTSVFRASDPSQSRGGYHSLTSSNVDCVQSMIDEAGSGHPIYSHSQTMASSDASESPRLT
jgi:hypothetical protein